MNDRLALLAAVEKGIAEGEVLRLALQHAVAELDGLGGTVHLCGPMSALRLVSTVGLSSGSVRPWEIIDQESPAVPARAVRRRGRVWAADGSAGAVRPGVGKGWPGSGLASVALSDGVSSVGSLTVVTGPAGEPTEEQWRFLEAVTAWAQERVDQAPPPTRPTHEEPSGSRLRQALKAVEVGTWDWNIRTGELAWDDAAMAVYGTDPTDFVPRVESWMKVVHPDDLRWTLAAAEKAIRDRGVFEAEYRVRRPDGSYGWTETRAKVVLDDRGEPYRMIGTAWESNESRSARDALSRALRYMSDGFLSADEDWRITFVNLEAEDVLGSSEEELFGRVLWTLPSVRQVPGLESRCREAAAKAAPTSFDVRMPDTGSCYQVRLVPLPDGVTLYFTDVTDRRRHEAERAAAERAAGERAARIAELTAALAKATTSRDVVDAVAQRVLPPFAATGLLVQALEDGRAHNVGSVGYPQSFLDNLQGRPRGAEDPVWEAISTSGPVFVSSAEEYAARYPAMADRPHLTGKGSWAFLPLTASGLTFGVCVVAFDQPRRLTDEERTLLSAISALVAHALERARLYDAEHTRSRELQSALLPQQLPALPSCELAARYLPTEQGADVGGDWYDVIPLSAGRVAFVIGDVMGHGLSEAVTMGRLRTAVHTLAGLELPPDEIMGHLNDIVGGLGADSYATCLYVLYDSTTGTCSVTRAGHPPPAVVHPDGTVRFPKAAPNPPLGAAEQPFESIELQIPEESLLVLFTDGLVESSEREIDEGLGDLARLLADADGADLGALCDTLISRLLPVGRTTSDDIALLVARVHALAPDRIACWPLPEDPRAAGIARGHVRDQLATWGLEELTPTTELLASELVGNVVRHGRGPMTLRLLRDIDLVCEVSDDSLTMPRIRHASDTDEGGRGLQLVASLSQRWGTRYTPNGKCIWTAQQLPDPDVCAPSPEPFDLDAVPPLE
ncbi:SpoIIE family protein phosphatase [Actinacidiphila glaucinigra]|uniref:SpoIIE family protein phosphatase n=1 Tax=Actinacidiphila glaucinigra TaxID=235986 RepID=UPI002DDC158D|nr:SpoIIE family protein phosphatase [Actinacidiphila glaucinigra]WSD58252.1 SpoIIE family protein phosphatase [Actinacidiphila glaucinigra]